MWLFSYLSLCIFVCLPCLCFCRPNMENTGQVSESGSSTVKHALNPDKTFMQVHYLKVRGVCCASSRQGMMGEAGADGKIGMFLFDVLGAGCVMDVAVAVEFLCIVFGGPCIAVFTCLVFFVQGYFLLRFLASQVGERQFIDFFRLFVKKYHGQLILSQVRLRYRKFIFTSLS